MVCKKQFGQVSVPNAHKAPSRRYATAVLLLILLLAAFLRLVNLGQSPPGLNQDEAANAWNAYCLLKTGKDQVGDSWPIFYSRCLGTNRSTLYYYALLPFQAVGGLNVQTTRLPNAVGGVITVLLLYLVSARLFGRAVGLVAAALLTFNPWHLQLTRWGHEAGLCPLLVMLPLALILAANLPIGICNKRRPRPLLAALAGVVTGICCYGYPSVRLFLPVLIFAAVLVTLPAWRRCLKNRNGALAVILFVVGFSATFGPLVYKHLTEPEKIARRTQKGWLWESSDSITKKTALVLKRYPPHFGLDFLFIKGDLYPIQSSPGAGQYHWYMLPLLVLGLITLFRRLKSSHSARILLVFIITYPVGDIFIWHISLHALRSSPGLPSLIILAALGTVTAATWLYRHATTLAVVALTVLIIAAAAINVRYLRRFFGPYNQQIEIYYSYHVDLIEACDWLRPHFDEVDAVFCTTQAMNMPYIVTLVALGYDPHRWFSEARDFATASGWDIYTRYGKMHFMYYDDSVKPMLSESYLSSLHNRVIFIVRPGELGLKDPVHRIRRHNGQETLWICRP